MLVVDGSVLGERRSGLGRYDDNQMVVCMKLVGRLEVWLLCYCTVVVLMLCCCCVVVMLSVWGDD